jgi:hypothetical protein
MTYRTPDQIASEFIAEGQRRNITERGIVICISTGIVESALTVYANSKVPASLLLPHDAVGSDGFSVGPLQQQVVMGANGWWWSDAATCMDPTSSCGLFYDRLVKLDYNGPNSPGSYAQAIQQSAYPDRYDQEMGAAQAIYDRLAGAPVPTPTIDPRLTRLEAAAPDFNEYPVLVSQNFQDRNGTTVDLLLGHTEESSGYDSADGLAHWLETTTNTGNPVSYHRTLSKGQNDDGVTVCDVVPINEAAWAVGNSNNRSINTCFAGSSVNWTRQEWITNCGRCFDVFGYLAVRDAITLGWTSIPVIPGPNYNAPPPGVSDHRYCTDYLKDGNTHVDMGDNVPWDLIEAAVTKYWAIATAAPTPTPVPTPIPGGNVPQPPQFPQPPATTDEAVMQIWGALFNAIPSESRYATPGGLYMTKDFINFTDARVHEINVERLALMGEPSCVALVKTAAAAGDTIAQLVLAKIPST